MDKRKKLTFKALMRDSGWWVFGEIVKKALAHEGFEVEVAPAPREKRMASVASGEVDFGVNNESELWWAFHGSAQDEGRAITNLRAIACVGQPTWLAFGVTRETRLTAIEQIKERKFPLRIYTPHARWGGRISSKGYLTDRIFEAYGFTLQDIERWGGKIWTGENGGNEAIRERNFDAIIYKALAGYGPTGKRWQEVTILNNMRFLPFASNILDEFCKKYHLRQGFIPKGLMRGVEENVPTFFFPYRIIFTSDHMDEELAFLTAKGLDEHSDYFLETHIPTSYNPFTACQDTGVPFHPGAERYYRLRGYMK